MKLQANVVDRRHAMLHHALGAAWASYCIRTLLLKKTILIGMLSKLTGKHTKTRARLESQTKQLVLLVSNLVWIALLITTTSVYPDEIVQFALLIVYFGLLLDIKSWRLQQKEEFSLKISARKMKKAKLARVFRLSGQQIRYIRPETQIVGLSGHRFRYSSNQESFRVHLCPITERLSANCPKTGVLEGRNVSPHHLGSFGSFGSFGSSSSLASLSNLGHVGHLGSFSNPPSSLASIRTDLDSF